MNRMEIGKSTADTMVLMLMHIVAVLNSLSQHSKRKVLDVNALQFDDMKLVFSRDVKNVLRREDVKRKGIK